MSENGTAPTQSPIQHRLDEMLGDIINPLVAQRDQLKAEEDDLMAQVTEIRKGRQRLDAVLRHLTPKEPEEKPKPKSQPKKQPVSEERLGWLELAVQATGPDAKVSAIRDHLIAVGHAMADPTIYSGLRMLREQERIRAKPDPNGRSDAKLYTAYEEATVA